MKEHDFGSMEHLKEKIETEMVVDPLCFDVPRSRDDLFVIIGEKDNRIPTRNQYAFWEAHDRPRALFIPRGHLGTVLAWRQFLPEMDEYLAEALRLFQIP